MAAKAPTPGGRKKATPNRKVWLLFSPPGVEPFLVASNSASIMERALAKQELRKRGLAIDDDDAFAVACMAQVAKRHNVDLNVSALLAMPPDEYDALFSVPPKEMVDEYDPES